MTVDDLASYVEAIAVCSVITYLPDELDDVVMVRFTGGQRDAELLTLREPTFQVFIRNRDSATAENLAISIEKQIHGAQAVIAGYVCDLLSKNEPYSLGQDAKQRYMYSLNFEMTYQT